MKGWRSTTAHVPVPTAEISDSYLHPWRQPLRNIGGYVVRDPDLPALEGRYLYGDACRGVVRSFRPRVGLRTRLTTVQPAWLAERLNGIRRGYAKSIEGVYRGRLTALSITDNPSGARGDLLVLDAVQSPDSALNVGFAHGACPQLASRSALLLELREQGGVLGFGGVTGGLANPCNDAIQHERLHPGG